VPAALNDVHDDGPRFFKRDQVLGNACLTGTDGIDDVSARHRAASFQVPDDFDAGPIAERLD